MNAQDVAARARAGADALHGLGTMERQRQCFDLLGIGQQDTLGDDSLDNRLASGIASQLKLAKNGHWCFDINRLRSLRAHEFYRENREKYYGG